MSQGLFSGCISASLQFFAFYPRVHQPRVRGRIVRQTCGENDKDYPAGFAHVARQASERWNSQFLVHETSRSLKCPSFLTLLPSCSSTPSGISVRMPLLCSFIRVSNVQPSRFHQFPVTGLVNMRLTCPDPRLGS